MDFTQKIENALDSFTDSQLEQANLGYIVCASYLYRTTGRAKHLEPVCDFIGKLGYKQPAKVFEAVNVIITYMLPANRLYWSKYLKIYQKKIETWRELCEKCSQF